MISMNRTAREFGRAATRYEAAAILQSEAADWLMEIWPPDTGPAVDLGSGPGILASRRPGESWLQIDLAEPMARQAARYSAAICADASRLPLVDASVRRLASGMCLQWLPLAGALTEWRRVAAPGAVLVATLPVAGSLPELAESHRRTAELPRLLLLPDRTSLETALLTSGWQIDLLDSREFVRKGSPVRLIGEITTIGAGYKGPLPRLGVPAMRRLLAAYPLGPDGTAYMTWNIVRFRAIARVGT